MTALPSTLLIACGALAREIMALKERHDWQHMEVQCLPANLHNRPQLIPQKVREKIHEERDNYDRLLVLYADCGTGGLLDEVLEEEQVQRIPGPHCYDFYSGSQKFQEMSDADPCVFYLTDYLVRHFDTLIIKGLGLDRFPELLNDYFGNYTRLMYLAQTEDDDLKQQAMAAAEKLGLQYDYLFTGYGELETYMAGATPAQAREAG